MKRLLLAVAAGVAAVPLPVAAQEYVNFSLAFVEVSPGSNEPVPNPNGTLEPGEAARFELTIDFTPVGTPATYYPPPPPGVGVVAGLNSITCGLNGTDGGFAVSPLAKGVWSHVTRASGWALGGPSVALQGGAKVVNIQAGQFLLPGMTANPENPIHAIWSGVWTPSDYAPRTLVWRVVGPYSDDLWPGWILIQYGVSPTGSPEYIGKIVPVAFGSATIPIIPAPASFTLLAVFPALFRAHRRLPE